MMIKVFLFVCCVLLFFSSDVKGGCDCGWSCSLQCDFSGNCKVVCGVTCRCKRRRRSVLQETLSVHDNLPQRGLRVFPIPLPFKFSVYDKDADGFMSLEEFRQTLPPLKSSNAEDVRKGFRIFDKDGNNKIDCSEFIHSKIDTDGKRLIC